MVWLEFLISSALIVFAAIQLAKYGDVIAMRTRLGGMFIGVLLMASATSLPEVLTTINSINQGYPNLAAGNLLGSNMFNMLLLAVLDLVHYRERILRKAALKHALTGSLAVLLTTLVTFFILARIQLRLGWVGIDSLLIMLSYIIAIRLIQSNMSVPTHTAGELPADLPALWQGILGFLLASALLVFTTPWLVSASADIAEITGLGTTFIGSTLVAMVTSLPELATTLAAARLGADDMAIGNLFGSNLFNMFAIGLSDLFFVQGLFLSTIDQSFLLVGMLGLIMTILGLIGNLARIDRRFLFVEIDALMLIVVYLVGMWLLYLRGVG